MTSARPVEPSLGARGHHLPAAVLAALAVGLLVGLPELLGDLGRLVAVLALQLGLVLAWVLATGTEGFAGSLVVGTTAAVATDLALLLPQRPSLGGLLAVFGVGFLGIVLQQMLRRQRRALVASLSGGVLLVCAVGSLGAVLLLGRGADGDGRAALALLAAGTALVVGHLVDLVAPHPRPAASEVPRGLVGVLASVASAGALGWLLRDAADPPGAPVAALVGAAVGAVAALTAVAASYLVVEATSTHGAAGERAAPGPAGPQVPRWSLPVVQAVLPVAAAAPVALALQGVL